VHVKLLGAAYTGYPQDKVGLPSCYDRSITDKHKEKRAQISNKFKVCITALLLFEAAISFMMVNELAEDYVLTEVSLESVA
jgi:uncharacterized protein (UPF0333 family)